MNYLRLSRDLGCRDIAAIQVNIGDSFEMKIDSSSESLKIEQLVSNLFYNIVKISPLIQVRDKISGATLDMNLEDLQQYLKDQKKRTGDILANLPLDICLLSSGSLKPDRRGLAEDYGFLKLHDGRNFNDFKEFIAKTTNFVCKNFATQIFNQQVNESELKAYLDGISEIVEIAAGAPVENAQETFQRRYFTLKQQLSAQERELALLLKMAKAPTFDNIYFHINKQYTTINAALSSAIDELEALKNSSSAFSSSPVASIISKLESLKTDCGGFDKSSNVFMKKTKAQNMFLPFHKVPLRAKLAKDLEDLRLADSVHTSQMFCSEEISYGLLNDKLNSNGHNQNESMSHMDMGPEVRTALMDSMNSSMTSDLGYLHFGEQDIHLHSAEKHLLKTVMRELGFNPISHQIDASDVESRVKYLVYLENKFQSLNAKDLDFTHKIGFTKSQILQVKADAQNTHFGLTNFKIQTHDVCIGVNFEEDVKLLESRVASEEYRTKYEEMASELNHTRGLNEDLSLKLKKLVTITQEHLKPQIKRIKYEIAHPNLLIPNEQLFRSINSIRGFTGSQIQSRNPLFVNNEDMVQKKQTVINGSFSRLKAINLAALEANSLEEIYRMFDKLVVLSEKASILKSKSAEKGNKYNFSIEDVFIPTNQHPVGVEESLTGKLSHNCNARENLEVLSIDQAGKIISKYRTSIGLKEVYLESKDLCRVKQVFETQRVHASVDENFKLCDSRISKLWKMIEVIEARLTTVLSRNKEISELNLTLEEKVANLSSDNKELNEKFRAKHDLVDYNGQHFTTKKKFSVNECPYCYEFPQDKAMPQKETADSLTDIHIAGKSDPKVTSNQNINMICIEEESPKNRYQNPNDRRHNEGMSFLKITNIEEPKNISQYFSMCEHTKAISPNYLFVKHSDCMEYKSVSSRDNDFKEQENVINSVDTMRSNRTLKIRSSYTLEGVYSYYKTQSRCNSARTQRLSHIVQRLIDRADGLVPSDRIENIEMKLRRFEILLKSLDLNSMREYIFKDHDVEAVLEESEIHSSNDYPKGEHTSHLKLVGYRSEFEPVIKSNKISPASQKSEKSIQETSMKIFAKNLAELQQENNRVSKELAEAKKVNAKISASLSKAYEQAYTLVKDQYDEHIDSGSQNLEMIIDLIRTKMLNYKHAVAALRSHLKSKSNPAPGPNTFTQKDSFEEVQEESNIDQLEEEEEAKSDSKETSSEKSGQLRKAFEDLLSIMFVYVQENVATLKFINNLLLDSRSTTKNQKDLTLGHELQEQVGSLQINSTNLIEMIECLYENLMEYFNEQQEHEENADNDQNLEDLDNLRLENQSLNDRMAVITRTNHELQNKCAILIEKKKQTKRRFNCGYSVDAPHKDLLISNTAEKIKKTLNHNYVSRSQHKKPNITDELLVKDKNEKNGDVEEKLSHMAYLLGRFYNITKEHKSDSYKLMKIEDLLNSSEIR